MTARIWVEPVRHSDGRPKYNSRGQLYRTVLVAPMARCWSGYLAIVIVSLVPGSLRPHIHGFPGQLEHFLAYGAVVPHMVWRTAPHLRAWYPAFKSSGRSCFA